MGTLYKFFPFRSLFSLDNETLTAWWVVGTLIVAIYFALSLRRYLNSVFKEIQKFQNNFDTNKISGSSLLRDAWLSYSHTFLSNDGEREKTAELAENFFNQTTILPKIINLRFYLSIPSILVGLGILGTFVGLTVGIAGFDASSAETIRKSIEILLSGMGTAFVSSVWGGKLCRVIGQNFKLTKSDELRFIAEDTTNILKTHFSYKVDGTDILPGHVFRDLRINAEEQTRALKSFSTDLADGIRISTETINALGQSINLQYRQFFKDDVAPALRTLIIAADKLRETKEESSAVVIERVVSHLEESLRGMFKDFHSSISDTTIKQMEALATQLGMVGSSLNEFPKTVDMMTQKLNVSMTELQRMIQESSAQANSDAATSVSLMKEQVQESAKQLAEVIGSLQANSKSLIDSQDQNTQSVQKTMDSSLEIILETKELHSGFTNLLSQTELITKQIKGITDQLTQTGVALKGSSDNLIKVSSSLSQQMQTFIASNQQTLKELQASLEQARLTSKDYADKFSIIDKGLKGIFDQIQLGLSSYQSTTKGHLNEYLREFASQFTQAATAIRGATESLGENTEQLNDIFDKLIKNLPRK